MSIDIESVATKLASSLTAEELAKLFAQLAPQSMPNRAAVKREIIAAASEADQCVWTGWDRSEPRCENARKPETKNGNRSTYCHVHAPMAKERAKASRDEREQEREQRDASHAALWADALAAGQANPTKGKGMILLAKGESSFAQWAVQKPQYGGAVRIVGAKRLTGPSRVAIPTTENGPAIAAHLAAEFGRRDVTYTAAGAK